MVDDCVDKYLTTGAFVGVDEVGRGAIAGPVSVGVAAVYPGCGAPPAGLTDSKMLTPRQREKLCDPIRRWTSGVAVGHSSAEEIDRWGIIVALRLAARRALTELALKGIDAEQILLDGKHNWLTIPDPDLLTPADHPDYDTSLVIPRNVHTKIKADLTCSVVSAASVIAKVERDAIMVDLDERFPYYGWAHNKGYGAKEHNQAIVKWGVTRYHRRSWNLPSQMLNKADKDRA